MMKFNIDRQTIDELNILGKFRPGSVYHLFNHVKTRGGEQILDQLFHNPLTDSKQINERSETFRFFRSLNMVFPFDSKQVSNAQEFLESQMSKGLLGTWVSILTQKITSLLTRDERYRKNIQGLQDTITLIKQCKEFLQQIKSANLPSSLGKRVDFLNMTLNNRFFARICSVNIYQGFSMKDVVNYNHLLKSSQSESVQKIISFIHELDVYIAVGSVAAEKGFHFATAKAPETHVFRVKNLRHPCVENAIGNDLHLHENSNILFLTGANMAGKSTWMKSLGIAVYLAHMGFPVAADEMEFSVREGLYTSINVADNIALGYSHFYAEVVRVKQAAEAAASGKRLMLMFDELFKGTNVKDAYDGTLAITQGFAEYRDCLFVISTHIIEVGEALKSTAYVQFRYMPTILEGSIPRYTYRLKEGITEDRQGMMIIRNEKILDMLKTQPQQTG